MNYLLDTNACIALINGKPPAVRAKFQKATDAGAQVFVSSIALFELWYGVAKSSPREFNKKRLEVFLAGPVHPLPFEDMDAELAGAIPADLESIGKPIGAYDLLIAEKRWWRKDESLGGLIVQRFLLTHRNCATQVPFS